MPAVSTRGRASQAKPRSDAYTGLLLLSLLAQVARGVFVSRLQPLSIQYPAETAGVVRVGRS